MGFFRKIKQWISGSETRRAVEKDIAPTVDLDEILKKIAVYKRSTWMPVVDEEEEQLLGSKIGGKAYIPAGEQHPHCPNCQKELVLFLQLNPKDLPADSDLDLEPGVLVQLFYCTSQTPHCEVVCEAFLPFSKSVVARTIPLPTTGEEPNPQEINYSRQYKEKLITDWIVYEDLPDWQEMQVGDARLSDAEVEALENSSQGVPQAADKLGGWPYWVQGVEYPHCPECGIQMQMIFQLDSNHHLPYMFGDAGIGHLHQCRLHKNVLAFGWAAY